MYKATAMQIDNDNDAELLHTFVWGLKKKYYAEIRLHIPEIQDEAAYLELDFDELLCP